MNILKPLASKPGISLEEPNASRNILSPSSALKGHEDLVPLPLLLLSLHPESCELWLSTSAWLKKGCTGGM